MIETFPLSALHGHTDVDRAFRTYQEWIRRIFPLLLFCDETIGEQYNQCREYLFERFPQLRTRMAPDLGDFEDLMKQNNQRETLCNNVGFSPWLLDHLEQDGIVQPPTGVPARYSPQDQKKIYWTHFFEKEMDLDQAGIDVLLVLFDFVRNRICSPGNGVPSADAQRTVIEELLHDIGTPLHIIGGRAGRLKRKLAGSEIAEKDLSIIQGQVDKLIELLKKYTGEA